MFPFAGFNLFSSLNLITGFLNPKPGAFFQYNTERINTFFYLSSSQRSYAVNFKIYQGLIGLGVDNLDPFLGLGGYAEALFFFQEVLKLDPKNEKALKAVERIRKILEER